MIRYDIAVAGVTMFLLSCGCRASREIVKSVGEVETKTEQTILSRIKENKTENIIAKTEVIRDEEIVTEVTEFDTSLPVDSATGTAPVKRKISQTKRRATEAQQNVEADRHTFANKLKKQESMEKSERAVITETKVKHGQNRLQSLLCLTGILTLMIMLIKILIRKIK